MRPKQFWPLMWGVVCVLLAAVVALEFAIGGAGAGTQARAPAKVIAARLLPAFTLPPEALSGSESASRPLFMPGRRPAPPAAAVDIVVMKKGQFLLQGTTVVGDLAFAMLKEIASGKVHRVQKGGKVLDLTLTEVMPAHAVLTLGSDSETVPLLVAKSSGAAAAAAAAAAAVNRGPFQPTMPAQAGGQQAATVTPQPQTATVAPQQQTAGPQRAVDRGRARAPTPTGATQSRTPTGQPDFAAQGTVPNVPISFDELARQRAIQRSGATN